MKLEPVVPSIIVKVQTILKMHDVKYKKLV